jgi:hypothetical protein
MRAFEVGAKEYNGPRSEEATGEWRKLHNGELDTL